VPLAREIEFRCDRPVDPLPPGAVVGCNGNLAGLKGTNTHQLLFAGVPSDGTAVGNTVADRNLAY